MATRKKSAKQSRKQPAPPAPSRVESSASAAEMPESDPHRKPFVPEVLDRTAIAIPLLKELKAENEAFASGTEAARKLYDVIIDLHLEYPGGRDEARKRVTQLVKEI